MKFCFWALNKSLQTFNTFSLASAIFFFVAKTLSVASSKSESAVSKSPLRFFIVLSASFLILRYLSFDSVNILIKQSIKLAARTKEPLSANSVPSEFFLIPSLCSCKSNNNSNSLDNWPRKLSLKCSALDEFLFLNSITFSSISFFHLKSSSFKSFLSVSSDCSSKSEIAFSI